MKNLIAAALLMIGTASFAQESPKQDKDKAKTEHLTPEQRQQLRLKKLTLELNLNASQQKEFGAILQENKTKREAAKAVRSAKKDDAKKHTPDERFAMKNKMLDEQIAMKERVKKILSPEQFSKWEKMQEGDKHGMKRRMKHNMKHKEHKPEKQN